jgi:hypothetical protein
LAISAKSLVLYAACAVPTTPAGVGSSRFSQSRYGPAFGRSSPSLVACT